MVHRKMILNEFIAQFDCRDRSELVKVLAADSANRIIEHLSNVLLSKLYTYFARLLQCYASANE